MAGPTSGSSLARSSAVMASGSMVSRVLGLVRQSMILAIFGLGMAGNAWQVANSLPNMIYLLIAGGIFNAVLVPQITKASADPAHGRQYVDRLLTLSILTLGGITLACMPLAPLLVRIFASGQWAPETFDLATRFALWCLPSIFFYGLYSVLGQVLNARGRFGWFMWSPVLCNVVWIVGLIVFHVRFGGLGGAVAPWTSGAVAWLGGTMTLGVAVQALVLIWPLWRDGFRYTPRWGFRGFGLGSAYRVAGWTFAALVVGQLGIVIQSQVLTTADPGDVSKLGYDSAYLLFMTPHGLITVSLVTALFTGMSHSAHRADRRAVAADASRGLSVIGATTIPIVVGAFALGPALTRVVFPRNTIEATDAMAYVMVALLLGLTPLGMTYLVQRAFYAYEDAKTPFRLQIVTTVMTSVTALAALAAPSPYRGVFVALGTALAAAVTTFVGIVWLQRKLGWIELGTVTRTCVRALIASSVPGLAAYVVFLLFQAVPGGRTGSLLALIVGGLVFLALFVRMMSLLHLTEAEALVRPLLARAERFLPRRQASV